MKSHDAKLVQLEHSKAKIELYSSYLGAYLNILSRVPYIKRIHLYDLMCGEGKYEDGSKGSPIIAIEKIKNHYFTNNKTIPNLKVMFNDKDESQIEKGTLKVDRVKKYISEMFVPKNVEIEYSSENYLDLFPKVLKTVSSFRNEKALLFIDPYGYKEIHPDDLKRLLSNGNVEIILFLPVSHMYRFQKKSLSEDDFPGGEPLKEFLLPLFRQNIELKGHTSVLNFIENLKKAFRVFLKNERIFVDTFSIERSQQNTYSLFFFTPNILGFEKMLEAKWKIDEKQGKGFKILSKQTDMFSEIQISNFPNKLKHFISSTNLRTNGEVYLFGLENGFLPRHANKVLMQFQKEEKGFSVISPAGEPVRKAAFYINYSNFKRPPKKIVMFQFIED